MAALQREVDKRRKKLIGTIAYPLAGASAAGARGKSGPSRGEKSAKRTSVGQGLRARASV